MPYIEIVEKDETSAGAFAENFDVVYIPGLVDTTQIDLWDDTKYVGLAKNEPTLFTSVNDFEALCGKIGYVFTSEQKYADITTYTALTEQPENWASTYTSYYTKDGDTYTKVTGTSAPTFAKDTYYEMHGFEAEAIPFDGVMFKAKTVDPSYVMAKELLASGLNVVYERINNEIPDYQLLKTEPADWSTKYNEKYYTKSTTSNGDTYRLVTGDTAPDFAENTYYEVGNIKLIDIYKALPDVFDAGAVDGLIDKGNIDVKYLTSGGYPTYEYDNSSIATKMIAVAEKRGDCVAFIDPTDNALREKDISKSASLYYAVINDQAIQSDFATMFTPWEPFNRITTDKIAVIDPEDSNKIKYTTPDNVQSTVRMSATFAYLTCLADSIKTNANWLAIAGSARGVLLNLVTDDINTKIPNGVADAMQPRDGVAVNAITNIKPYGYTIWGNRTLKNNGLKRNLTATSLLNIRNLVSDVKKTAYKVARQLTFEQNNDVLWVNFKSLIAPTLDRMLSGYGISGYKIIRDTEHAKASEKATVCAKIILYPVYAVEDFYITIVLKDDEISVE